MMPIEESSRSVIVNTLRPSSWVTAHGHPSVAPGRYRITTVHSLLVVTLASLRARGIRDLNVA